jgi:hypothetical protein
MRGSVCHRSRFIVSVVAVTWKGEGKMVAEGSSLTWLAWTLLGFAIVPMLAWLWQLDDRSRDAERILKEIREIVLRLDTQSDAER